MIEGKFSTAFPLKHQQKDMRLALALGDEVAQSLPVAAAANEVQTDLSSITSSSLRIFIIKVHNITHLRSYKELLFNCGVRVADVQVSSR